MSEYKDRVRRELYDCILTLYPELYNRTFDEIIELVEKAIGEKDELTRPENPIPCK